MSSISQSLFNILYNVCIIYVILVVLFYLISDFIIFIPPKPTAYQAFDATHVIEMENGEKMYTTHYPNPQAQHTVLFSHGNAEDLATLDPFLRYFHQQGYSVFAYDYSGYGLSEGKAKEKNTYQNIFSAYAYLIKDLKIAPENIIVYGRSLGGGPSVELASQKPVGGLILEGTFTSAYQVKTRYPIIPFDKYKNIQKISKVKAPILFIHGSKDSIIPIWHARALYDKATAPKTFYEVPEAGHNDLLLIAGPHYWHNIQKFVSGIKQ